VTALSTHLKLSFNQFVDGEIEWLNALKPNPKRCGILQPFAKFPALVDRMENVVRSGAGAAAALSPTSKSGSAAAAAATAAAAASQARSQAADTSYQKLASALFRWLDGVAKSDDKYTDVVVMENAHHYHTMFSSPFLSVPALEQSVAKAGAAYREHMARYVAWNIAYEMPAVTKFWARIEDQLKSILPEEIPFASELSKVGFGSSMGMDMGKGEGGRGRERESTARSHGLHVSHTPFFPPLFSCLSLAQHDLRALNKGPLSAKPVSASCHCAPSNPRRSCMCCDSRC